MVGWTVLPQSLAVRAEPEGVSALEGDPFAVICGEDEVAAVAILSTLL